MFIVLSFAWGLAVFHLVQTSIYMWNEKVIDSAILQRKKHLLGVFVLGSLYMVAAYHLTNLYFAHQSGFERFILLDGGIYPSLFWWGYVVLGNLLPLLLLYLPGIQRDRWAALASLLIIIGGFALLYVFIIGGQAYPLNIFPGYQVSSSFADGQIAAYRPSLYEFLLGFGGLAIAFIITLAGMRVLNFMPQDKPYIAD